MESEFPTCRRIAMWSGPRNISTALMRSWGNRPDTAVMDEPLYAAYLKITGLVHPGRDEILRHHDADWHSVVKHLAGPVPYRKVICYQKHMAHHLLPEFTRDWLTAVDHCFLIREPREMLTSLLAVWPNAGLADTGLPQQLELVQWVKAQQGKQPIILDARDVLQDPRKMIVALCGRLNVPFFDEMLHWPAGPRSTDGVWARHWYDRVNESTTFEPYRPKSAEVPPALQHVLDACHEIYQQLYAGRIRPEG